MSEIELLSARAIAKEVVEQCLMDLLLAPATRLLLLTQSSKSSSEVESKSETKKGAIYYFLQIFKREGFLGFWKGNLLESLKNSITRICKSYVLRIYQPLFLRKDLNPEASNSSFREFLLLCAVEFSILLIQHPFKTVRIKMSALTDRDSSATLDPSKTQPTTLVGCIKKIFDEEGIRGFYRGFSLAVLQAATAISLLYLGRGIAHKIRPDLETHKHKRNLMKDLILSGSAIGMISTYAVRSNTIKQWKSDTQRALFKMFFSGMSTLILYPMTVAQYRMIADESSVRLRSSGPVQELQRIWEKDGIKGLYRGFTLSVFTTVGSAILYPVVSRVSKKVVNVVIPGEKVEESVQSQAGGKNEKRKRRRGKFKKLAAEKAEKLKEKKNEYSEKAKEKVNGYSEKAKEKKNEISERIRKPKENNE